MLIKRTGENMEKPFVLALYNNKEVSISWSQVLHADAYEVEVFGADGQSVYFEKTDAATTSLHLSVETYPFRAGGIYFVSLRTWLNNQAGFWTEPVALVINNLQSPVNVVTYEAGAVMATVSNPDADFAVYTFQIQEKTDSYPTEQIPLSESLVTTKALPLQLTSQVVAGKIYQIRSALWRQNAVSGWSDFSEITIVDLPQPLLRISYVNKTIQCSWAEISTANGYDLELWDTGSSPQRLLQKNITAPPYEVNITEGFKEDQIYDVRLRAYQGPCYSAWDEKEIYTSSLSPVLKDLYDRLTSNYTASGNNTLTLDATTLGPPAEAIITLFKNHLGTERIFLNTPVVITSDPEHDQVLVNGVCKDSMLGIDISILTMAFTTEETKTDILIYLSIPTGSDWRFTRTFPFLKSTYIDSFTFDTSEEVLPTFILCSTGQPDSRLMAGLNFQGNINVTGALADLVSLIPGISTTIAIAGTIVSNGALLEITLKGQVPDVRLNFTGFQTLNFVKPELVFHVKQDSVQNYISLMRWVESDVTLSEVSIPLAVKLPDAVSGWTIMLTPGKTVPLGNVPSFLAFIAGIDLSTLLPDAINTLNCFDLSGFKLSFDKDQTTFNSLEIAIGTAPSQIALWTILPCLAFNQLNLQLKVYPKNGGLAYRAAITGKFSLSGSLFLQARLVLPIDSSEWIFNCYSIQPIDSLTAISSLMNGADFASYLPQGLGTIGQFELSGLTLAYDPSTNKLTRLGINIATAGTWTLIKDRLVVEHLRLYLTMTNPFDTARIVTGMVQGSLSIGQGGIRATIGKQTADSSWRFTVELSPGTSIAIADIAGLAGVTEADIKSCLPSQLSVLGSLALTQFYVEYDIIKSSLNNVSFTISLSTPWSIYQDKIEVRSSSLRMSITPATGTTAYAISAYIEGTITLGDVNVIINATNEHPDQNWLFNGGLDDDSVIVFDDIFTEVGLDGLSVPYKDNFPKSLTIRTLNTEIAPGIPTFCFEADSAVDWNIDFAMAQFTIKALNARLTLNHPKDTAQTAYIFKAGGSFVFCDINADLALQISNDMADSVLFAELTTDNAKEIKVADLANTLATDKDQGRSWSKLPLPADLSNFGYVSAHLHINLSQNTFILFGASDKFGAIGFLTRQLDDKSWGYFVGLALSEDFTFASICPGFGSIDSILSIHNAGFSICSFTDESVQKLTANIPEFQNVICLPEGSDPVPLKPGLTIYGTIVFNGDLFGKVREIIHDLHEDSGITIYSFISQQASQSIFTANLGTFYLFDADTIEFEQIVLSYQPEKPDDPAITNVLLLTGTIKIKIDDYNRLSFDNSFFINSQKASFSMATTKSLHSPLGMFNINLESLSLNIDYIFAETMSVTIALTGTVAFGKPDQKNNYPVVLDGSVLFDNGVPVVCALSLVKALSIDDFLITVLPDNLWPLGWLEISFEKGSIYYAKEAGTYFGTTYRGGYNIDSTINIYGLVFIIAVQVQESGLVFTGQTDSAIDLIFAKLTAKDCFDASPTLEISTVENNKKFGFSLGVQLFGANIGTADLLYSIPAKQFEGKLVYNGTILGTQDPSIGFAWNEKTGLQILDMPLHLESTAYDYAKQLDKLSATYSSGSGCAKLVGMAFNKVMKTIYDVNVVPGRIEATEEELKIPLQLICTIQVASQNILSQSLGLPLVIRKPREMTWQGFLDSLLSTVINSADAIVKKLLTDPDEFVKLIAVAGLQKMTSSVLTSLMCRQVKSVSLQAQSEAEVCTEASNSETIAEDAVGSAQEAEAAQTAAEAALSGAVAIDAVLSLDSTLAEITGLVAGLLSLFGVNKSDEQKKVEANQKKAEESLARVRKAVEAKLNLPAPWIRYQEDDTINVSCQTVTGGGDLTYTFILLKGLVQIGTQFQSGNAYIFSNENIEPGESYTVKVKANLTNRSICYSGEWSQETINVPDIPSPINLTIFQVEANFQFAWKSGDGQSTRYMVRVENGDHCVINPQPQIIINDCQAAIDNTGLIPGSTYYIQVRAVNQEGHLSKWSSIQIVDSGMKVPEKIAGESVSQQDNSIILKSAWQPVVDADHYAVVVMDETHQPISPQPKINITGCEVTVASPAFVAGKTIHWRVASQNSDSTQSVWSQDQKLTFLNLPVPSGLELIYKKDDDTITATWNAENAQTYSFKLLDSAGGQIGDVQTDLTRPEASVGGSLISFDEGKIYTGQVKALAENAVTVWSPAVSIIIIKLATPEGLALVYDPVGEQVIATWQTVPGATSYEFELSDAQGKLVGPIQSATECKVQVGGKKTPLMPGAVYRGKNRARTIDCLGSWCGAVSITIPKIDPIKELASQLKSQGMNIYKASQEISRQLPDAEPLLLAKDLYIVFQPPMTILDDMALALWFDQVKESDARAALKTVYPEATDQQMTKAIQVAWHPNANELAANLKLVDYTAGQALAKMRTKLSDLDIAAATHALANASYPLLDSAKAINTSYMPQAEDLAQNLAQAFQLIVDYGLAPMAAALDNIGLPLSEISVVMKNLYGSLWNIDAYSLVLTIYNSDEWAAAIAAFHQQKNAKEVAVSLKQKWPDTKVTVMDTILAAIFDLYRPHQSVKSMTEALKASGYSLSEASIGMKSLYQSDWTIDDYEIMLIVYNET